MDLNLSNKVAIVTGGASGIGEGIVEAFVEEKVKVAIVGRNPKRGMAIVEKMENIGGEVIFIEAELAELSNCEKAVAQTVDAFGQIDILVNNAGKNDGVGLTAHPDDFFESVRNNLYHYFALAHLCLPYLKKTKGTIINIGSKVANTGQGGTSGYAASKGGCQALTREWAAELLPYQIRVNEVIPAETWTPLYENWLNTFDNPEAEAEKITRHIPFGKRFTTVKEIADTVLFVASQRSSHTTGQLLYVDGGYTHLDRKI